MARKEHLICVMPSFAAIIGADPNLNFMLCNVKILVF